MITSNNHVEVNPSTFSTEIQSVKSFIEYIYSFRIWNQTILLRQLRCRALKHCHGGERTLMSHVCAPLFRIAIMEPLASGIE